MISLKDLAAYSKQWCANHPDEPPELIFRAGFRYAMQMKEPVILDDAPIIIPEDVEIPVDLPSSVSSHISVDEPYMAHPYIPSFEDFWNKYDYKKAKPQALRMWKKLSLVQRMEVWDSLDAYLATTPDKQYRMHPATYINPANERWKDELTIRNNNNNGTRPSDTISNFDRDSAELLLRLSKNS